MIVDCNLYWMVASSFGNTGVDWGPVFKEKIKEWFPGGPPKDPINNINYRYMYGYSPLGFNGIEDCNYALSYCIENENGNCDIFDQSNKKIKIIPLCDNPQTEN
jgi:hypothetical protein